ADRRARPGYDSGACADCVAGGRDPAPQPAAGPVAPAVGAVVDGGGSYGGTRAVTTAAFRVGPVCANRPSAAIAPRYALIGRWLHLHRQLPGAVLCLSDDVVPRGAERVEVDGHVAALAVLGDGEQQEGELLAQVAV